jgi:anthraniloyl-CoA monooxygenase
VNIGGAGLVMAEMTCTSPQARITPGCPGLWNDAQRDAWRRIVDFVRGCGDVRIGVQLGHAGPKGSTNEPWVGAGADRPLARDNWSLLAPSARAYLPGVTAVPRAMTRADMERRGARPPPASTGWSCTARTAICSRPSSRRSPITATTPTVAR